MNHILRFAAALFFTIQFSFLGAQNTDKAITVPVPYDYKSEQIYKKTQKTSHYLTMRDGIKIAVDVYLPKGLEEGEQIPAILYQTRYWRGIEFIWPLSKWINMIPSTDNFDPMEFVKSGYALVAVDVRGSGASFGKKQYSLPGEKEVKDGAEIVDWIIEQSWSNGVVGATGISYIGMTAEYLLINQHPNVKAVAPLFSVFDLYDDVALPGGIFYATWLKQWNDMCAQLDKNQIPGHRNGLLKKLAVKGVARVNKEREDIFKDAIASHSGNYYQSDEGSSPEFIDEETTLNGKLHVKDIYSPHNFIDKINGSGTPIYSYSGWWDAAFPQSAVRQWINFNNPDNKMILGPWNHGGVNNISPFNPGRSEFDHMAEIIKFFDHHLKGINNGIDEEPPIHYYTMGEGKWKSSYSWPSENSKEKVFYFNEGQSMTKEKPAGNEAWDEYTVDTTFEAGNITRWRFDSNKLPEEYADLSVRDQQLLVYTTPPLKEDMEVTGHPVIKLYVSSTAEDGAFFVYLEDVDENGKVSYVTDGQLRAIHRKVHEEAPHYNDVVPYHSYSKDDAMPLKPGETAEIIFDLFPTSYEFKKGHSIRVAISGADSQHFKVIGKTEPELKIYRNKEHASAIILPVVED